MSMKQDDSILAKLDRTQYLLERMLELAECAASDVCSDEQRETLQKGFAFLQGLLEEMP